MKRSIVETIGPLRQIISEGYDRGPGYQILECGHQVSKQWGAKYGKRTRCHLCRQVAGWREDLQQIVDLAPRVDELLAQGKLANNHPLVWNDLQAVAMGLKNLLAKEDQG